MAITITPVENHREREKGIIVYPVYSRRSGGLSVGINLFPDKKQCPFDCPYCEVFRFQLTPSFHFRKWRTICEMPLLPLLNKKRP
jgi:histidinol dehydrogenase